LEGRDVSLLSVQLILVLGVGLFNLTQVLLHHVSLTDEIVDVLLFLISLFVNPLNLTGESRNGVSSDHLFVKSLLTLRFKGVILSIEILLVTLSLANDLL